MDRNFPASDLNKNRFELVSTPDVEEELKERAINLLIVSYGIYGI
jgi:hypothetical protein